MAISPFEGLPFQELVLWVWGKQRYAAYQITCDGEPWRKEMADVTSFASSRAREMVPAGPAHFNGRLQFKIPDDGSLPVDLHVEEQIWIRFAVKHRDAWYDYGLFPAIVDDTGMSMSFNEREYVIYGELKKVSRELTVSFLSTGLPLYPPTNWTPEQLDIVVGCEREFAEGRGSLMAYGDWCEENGWEQRSRIVNNILKHGVGEAVWLGDGMLHAIEPVNSAAHTGAASTHRSGRDSSSP